MCINFGCTAHFNDPCNQVLQNTLVELVENIRCDWSIDVDIEKVLPEVMGDRFQANLRTVSEEICRVILKGVNSGENSIQVA